MYAIKLNREKKKNHHRDHEQITENGWKGEEKPCPRQKNGGQRGYFVTIHWQKPKEKCGENLKRPKRHGRVFGTRHPDRIGLKNRWGSGKSVCVWPHPPGQTGDQTSWWPFQFRPQENGVLDVDHRDQRGGGGPLCVTSSSVKFQEGPAA